MYIFLDDERNPANVTWVIMPDIPSCRWTIVRNHEQFLAALKLASDTNELIEYVSFDHDLADQHYGPGLNNDDIDYGKFQEKTGLHCAKSLVDWCLDTGNKIPPYRVHSMNPVGKENIVSLLEGFKRYQGL